MTGAALALALGAVIVSGAGSAHMSQVSQVAPPAAVAGEIGPVEAPAAARDPLERTLPLDEARARWFERVYSGRTFAASEGLARHPGP